MADNIRIIGDVDNVRRISRINDEDLRLIDVIPQNKTFGADEDYIQYIVYNEQGEIVYSLDNYKKYKLPSDYPLVSDGTLPVIEINPVQDLEDLGYISGQFSTQYNFNKSVISGPTPILFIDEISEDRTEIRFNSTILSTSQLTSWGQYLGSALENSNEQINFLLNFQDNQQFLIINVAVDYDSPTPTLLLKLYKPLPLDIVEKTSGWISEDIIEPYVFTISLNSSVVLPPIPQLKGPNFDINIDIKQNVGTKYESYSSLVSSLTGSSYHKVLNYMNDNSYDLNIDYTSFSNFIHFSSAKKRLEVFYDKLNQIEDYNTDIDILLQSTSILKNEESSSIKLKIDEIAKNFDGYERYLYFESSSNSWPKTTNINPYKNKFINKQFHQLSPSTVWNFTHSLNETPTLSIYSGSTHLTVTQSSTIGINDISITFTSSISGYVVLSSPSATSWYNSSLTSATSYDENNLDHLYNVIPEYIKSDPDNYQPYYDFIDMIGHYFDNIWIYIDSINELYNADNNLEKGVSKDIVYDALRSLGVKLYNSKGNDDFDNYIGGSNSGSTLFENDFSVTSSYLNNIPKKDQLAELYKRIYHNIPLLSKTKGTSAGLQNLITSFGVTSSIFSPKEFGGSTKNSGLKGYDNDKITIQNNTITGSVLSPFISLQEPFTGSNDFTSTDLHFIDLSFSPQTQLDSRVSASIALSKPTFSLDDYIGDPGFMESGSYDSLNDQKFEHFTISGSITDKLDYKGFFELVKYFDNSLFKMLNDFVPARANALTGVTIKSPVLERNKIKVFHPKVNEETIYDAEYNAPIISEDRDYYYDKIEGDKSTFYTGEFTGSYANINDVFENSNPNPYLIPTESIDINKFNHSEFNVTLNNVLTSRNSVGRSKIENLYNTSLQIIGSYSSSAELQDSQLNLFGHKNSRYDGIKLSSKTYNTYSSASLTYSGDISYGKTAAIDHNTRKIGLFTQITENIFLPSTKKNNVALRYLVDESGSLTELNRKNKHWNELQNTFKAGDDLTVTLFNNQKSGDQKSTDGSKPIFNSGYNYVPMLYFSGSEPRAYFEYAGENVGKIFQAKNTIAVSPGPSGYIYGGVGGSNGYPLSPSGSDTNKKVVYNIFDIIESNDDNNFTAGNTSTTTYPKYVVPAAGSYTFNNQFDIYLDLKASLKSVSFKYEVIKGSIVDGHPTGTILATDTKTLTSSYSTAVNNRGTSVTGNPNKVNYTYSDSSYPLAESFSPLTIYDGSTKVVTLSWTGTSHTFTGDDSNTYYLVSAAWSYLDEPSNYTVSDSRLVLTQSDQGSMDADDYLLTSYSSNDFTSNQTGTLSFNLTTPERSLDKDDEIYFKLTKESSNTTDYTASFSSAGKLKNNLVANTFGDFVFALGSADNRLVSCSINDSDGNNNTIVLNSSLTGLENYQFVAEQGTGDNKTLYNNYGSVNEIFNPSPGDVVVMYWDNQTQNVELTIKQLGTKDSKRTIVFTTNLPSSLSTQLNANSTANTLEGGADIFLLLKKKPDETNILLKFNKKVGTTSLGFIIPNNLHPDVLANIDTITKEVKQKLIDFGTTDIGGAF